jgi:hypothetical protein
MDLLQNNEFATFWKLSFGVTGVPEMGILCEALKNHTMLRQLLLNCMILEDSQLLIILCLHMLAK